MFSKLLYGAAAVLFSTVAVAQEKTKSLPENRFSLSFGPQYNFNKSGVQNDPDGPKTISASNTIGGYIGLGYERKTRKGLVFSYDLRLGTQPQEVFVNYELSKFDPQGSIALTSLGVFSRSFNTSFHTLDNRFMVGYEHPIGNSKNGLYLQEKIGVTLSHLLSGTIGNKGERGTVTYSTDEDPDIVRSSSFIYILDNLDARDRPYTAAHKSLVAGYCANFYVGFVKKVDKAGLKSVSFGVEGRFSGYSGPADVSVQTTSSFNGGPGLQIDQYNSAYRSIGLHMALNFWK